MKPFILNFFYKYQYFNIIEKLLSSNLHILFSNVRVAQLQTLLVHHELTR